MENKILVYCAGNKEKADKIKTILANDYIVDLIDSNDLNQTLGYHFQLDGFDYQNNDSVEVINFDAMFLPIIPHEEIQELSKKLREQNIDIERKAMLTDHNRNWTVYDLLKEIDEEHTYFKKRAELNQLLIVATKISPDAIPDESKAEFQKAVLQTYDILQDKNSKTTDYIKSYEQLFSIYQKVI